MVDAHIQSRRERRRRRRQLRRRKFFVVFVSLVLIIFCCSFFFFKYQSEHFREETTINNVDCSNLTVEEAYQKINEHLANQEITYVFIDRTFSTPSSLYDIKLNSTDELLEILKKQNSGSKSRTYTLNNFYIDDQSLKEYLLTIDCLNTKNMRKPENAYLKFGDDNLFYIVPEVLGNEINFDEAYQLALTTLKSGNTTIDFTSITNTLPSVMSDDEELVTKMAELNHILSTTINYTLPNGNVFTLDSSIIKDWLYLDDEGIYQIELESNIINFVKTLSDKVTETNSVTTFNATDIGFVSIYLPKSKRATINVDAEITRIKEDLGSVQNRSPIYKQSAYTLSGKNSYVEIDITRQTVWMYVDGVCIVETPCVTGNASNHNTPSGVFTLTYKTTDTYLKGYNDDGSRYSSHVNYWMPFNGGIGLHDALWRDADEFGGTTYKGNGSHGCVNLPLSAAKTIYNNIDSTMPIIVYAS